MSEATTFQMRCQGAMVEAKSKSDHTGGFAGVVSAFAPAFNLWYPVLGDWLTYHNNSVINEAQQWQGRQSKSYATK